MQYLVDTVDEKYMSKITLQMSLFWEKCDCERVL